MAEIIEPMETVLQKAKTIAGWIQESKHFIACVYYIFIFIKIFH